MNKSLSIINDSINKRLSKYKLQDLPLEEYDFQILDIKPVRAAFLLKTNKGDFALKKANYNERKLTFIHSAIEHLYQNGFTKLARTFLTKDMKTHIKIGSRIYFLTYWVKGRESDLKNAKDMYSAAITLAEFHKASRGFEAPEGSKPKKNLGKWPKKYLKRCNDLHEFKEKLSTKTELNRFDRLFLANVDYYYEQGLKAIEALKKSSYQDLVEKEKKIKGFCHRDYTYHNLIINEQGEINVIDFDYCVIDIAIADISRFFQKVLRKSEWEFDKVKGLLNAYERVNSLTPEELQVLHISMSFPQKFWRLTRRYYDQTRNETENELFAKFKDIVDERKAREDFLNKFSRNIL